MLPTIYISHGSPELVLMNNDTTHFLKTLSKHFEEPKYILVISAHWLTKDFRILANEFPHKINDFYGFPQKLYEEEYCAKNDLQKVDEIVKLFLNNDIIIRKDKKREGYDHGVWAPLKLIYPNANIPIIQISLPMNFTVQELLRVGEILQTLREDTLIIASGSMTHNIRMSNWTDVDAPTISYAKNFSDWIVSKLEVADMNSLIQFQTMAPNVKDNHPTLEHFMPLFIALGASKSKIGKALHNIYMYGNQSMQSIIFKE